MFDQLEAAIGSLEASLSTLRPELMEGADAARLVGRCVHAERVLAGVRLRAARRVEATNAHSQCGHRNAASWLAEVSGTSTADAKSALSAAQQLEGLSATADALAQGLISEAEARHIASGASVDHTAEPDLLDSARRDSHEQLRDKARRRREAAQSCAERDRRIHANRRLTDWLDLDGSHRIGLRLGRVDAARLLAAIDRRTERIFSEARKDGRREPRGAYRLDALLSLVDDATVNKAEPSSSRVPEVQVNVNIDYAALIRGRTEPGEKCEIPGVGPVSVATARALLSDSVLRLLVTDGVDVYTIVHAGRTIPAHIRTALTQRDPVCCRPGCGSTGPLQIHHYRTDYHNLQVAELGGLARLCVLDHREITSGRARLEGGPGHWEWVDLTHGDPHPPSDPDPPPTQLAF